MLAPSHAATSQQQQQQQEHQRCDCADPLHCQGCSCEEKKKSEKEKLTLCFPQHPGERARSLLESGHSGVAEQSVFADRRQGTKDLWKGEMKKLSGWVSVVLLVFRPLVVLHDGRFVSVEDAS